ncbi:DUF1617 family protein [Lactococcus piscium]|uniref:Prophage protein n=1 Tax=Pseudolactococcus piscium MKFS47 TaxID=297352 RepID=A0A0D6DW04_9LACT|nr:DUF1617 family protein [Lactococcus piscium]CEN27974.1 Prophage protein [Lactococcus piscium MKFS47]
MLSLKNHELAPTINFLVEVKLSPKASRCRSKLVKKLLEKHAELKEDLDEITEKFGERDEDGKIIRSDEGVIKIAKEKLEEGTKEQQELMDEDISINLDEIKDKITFLVGKLDKLDTKLSGHDAEIYDTIMDKLEGEF